MELMQSWTNMTHLDICINFFDGLNENKAHINKQPRK